MVGSTGSAAISLEWNPPIVVIHSPAGSGGARGIDRLHIGDRVRVFERRVVPWTVAHQHQVVMVVDDPRHHGAAAQVDHHRLRSALHAGRMADFDEPPVLATTAEAIVFLASIVWILPLTSIRSGSGCAGRFDGVAAGFADAPGMSQCRLRRRPCADEAAPRKTALLVLVLGHFNPPR